MATIHAVDVWKRTGTERRLISTRYVNAPDGLLAVWYVAGVLRLKLEDWHGYNPEWILRDSILNGYAEAARHLEDTT